MTRIADACRVPTRIGLPDPAPLWQGAEPWGPLHVGRSSTATFHGVGCVPSSLALLLRALGNPEATPLTVQEAGLARPGVWLPGAAGCDVPELCRAQGLQVVADLDGPRRVAAVPDLRRRILAALEAGGGALVCVDDDAGRPGGDATGDHWIAAYAAEGTRLVCSDPALARSIGLDLQTLANPYVRWRAEPRPYQAVRAVIVTR